MCPIIAAEVHVLGVATSGLCSERKQGCRSHRSAQTKNHHDYDAGDEMAVPSCRR